MFNEAKRKISRERCSGVFLYMPLLERDRELIGCQEGQRSPDEVIYPPRPLLEEPIILYFLSGFAPTES